MKKKICSKVLVIMLMLAALFTSGCGPVVRLGAIMLRDAIKGDSPFFEASGSKWKTIKLEQNDGKILQLDLPFALNDNGEFESDDIVQNAEWHRYKNDSIFVSVDHCRLADSKKEVTFNLKTFTADFGGREKMHPKLKKIEKRTINGKEMTYAEIQAEDNGARTIECVGIHSGRESWTIIYAYRSDDKTMHKLVEKSIASISLG